MDMLADFHLHTFLSDGVLSPLELIRRAAVNGYTHLALTDHVGRGTMARVLAELKIDCALAEENWDLKVLPGVELTHVPAAAIADLAAEARTLGARVVVVHGETCTEPVEPGTNLAAASCPQVDILAHPGLLTAEAASAAAANGVFLEITARGGHNITNGLVAAVGRAAGCRLLVNSDCHAPGDLLRPESARRIAAGAGLSPEEIEECLVVSARLLLARVAERAGKT